MDGSSNRAGVDRCGNLADRTGKSASGNAQETEMLLPLVQTNLL